MQAYGTRALSFVLALAVSFVAWASPGDLDPAFGNAGVLRVDFGKFASVEVLASVVQSDGKIVVGGAAQQAGQPKQPFIARYNPDGTIDTAFGAFGWVFPRKPTNFPDADRAVRALAMGQYGDIFAVTDVSGPSFSVYGFYAINSYGQPTGSWTPMEDFSDFAIYPRAIAATADGGFLVTGLHRSYAGSVDTFVLKLTAYGTRDYYFGQSGLVVASFSAGDDDGRAIVMRSDGGFYVAGASTGANGDRDMFVARFRADGTLEPTFGNAGSVTIDFGGGNDEANSMVAVHAGEQLVLAGSSASAGMPDHPVPAFAMVRTDTGAVETQFGTGGQLTLQPPGGDLPAGNISSLILTPQLDLLAVGSVTHMTGDRDPLLAQLSVWGVPSAGFGSGGMSVAPAGAGSDVAIGASFTWDSHILAWGSRAPEYGDRLALRARYGMDGALDATFGTNGVATDHVVVSTEDRMYAVALQSDGKILAAGSSNFDPIVVRFLADGTPDSSFGTDGVARFLVSGQQQDVAALAVQADGRILAVSPYSGPEGSWFAVTRLMPDGTTDTSYGTSGSALVNVDRHQFPVAIALQADGKAVVAGYAWQGYQNYAVTHAAVMRLNTDGSLDASFNGTGKAVIVPSPSSSEQPFAVFVRADGKIVIVGDSNPTPSTSNMLAIRLTPSGALDSSWIGGGFGQVVFAANSYASAGVLQPDGKLVLGGPCGNDYSTAASCFARLDDVGALDPTFGSGGKVVADLFQYSQEGLSALAVQPDGAIVAAGGGAGYAATIRLRPDGSFDPSYATNGVSYLPSITSPYGAALQADGKLVLASDLAMPIGGDLLLARVQGGGDGIAPDTTITSGPTGLVNTNSASFAFTSNEAGTFECRIDGGTFAACSSPQAYSSLSDGSHTFEVRARDVAGNVDPTPASRSWTIDTTPPDTGMAFTPINSPTNSNSFTATLAQSIEPVTFECRLDGAAWTACTSPVTQSGLADGTHTFEVRAKDAAGNVDPTPASKTWTIDTVPPDTTIVSGPSGTVASNSAIFSHSSSEPPSMFFECRLDGGSWSPCGPGISYSNLADGTHTFDVRAKDAAGNIDPTPATRTWIVDTVPPDTAITSGPTGTVASTGASFGFSSEPGATFECRLDGAAFAACTSPATLSGLAQGAHTFDVRAKDAAGNVDPTPASRTWTVDTQAPDTTIVSGPSGAVSSTSATFTYGASETGSTFECRVDGAAFAACSASGTTYAGLAQGSHSFDVRAIDAVGNVDATPASRTWIVDTVAPDTTITGGPSGSNNPNTATFTFTATETATFQCALDTGAFTACSSGVTYNNLAKGDHTFQVRAIDAAGNVDPSPATRAWRSK